MIYLSVIFTLNITKADMGSKFGKPPIF